MCYTIIKKGGNASERLHGSKEPKNLPLLIKKYLTINSTYDIIIIGREVINYDEKNVSI